jgi:hypothetical protein
VNQPQTWGCSAVRRWSGNQRQAKDIAGLNLSPLFSESWFSESENSASALAA